MRPITVWVDDVPYGLRLGAEAWVVAGRLPAATRLAIATGQAYLADAAGHEIGSGGALADGHRLYVVWRA